MDKRFLLILTLIVVAFAGIFWISKSKSAAPGNGNTGAASNHVEGTNTTGVSLVEYGDYQCPACGQYYPIIKQLQTQFASKISFQFANFPLVQIHKNAMAAARAAEAASLQGKFWEMHDALYDGQKSWSEPSDPTPYFDSYARQLGLNLTKFKTDRTNAGVLATINADVAKAQALGATGTPTFVLNGKRIDTNPGSLDAFTKLINDTIAKQKR